MLANELALQKEETRIAAPEQAFCFVKLEGCWRLVLPSANGGKTTEVVLTSGIDELLHLLARRSNELWLQLERTAFAGASVLVLDEFCPAPRGGAYYRIYPREGKPLKQRLWVCEVSLLIFGDLPERIYFRLLRRK